MDKYIDMTEDQQVRLLAIMKEIQSINVQINRLMNVRANLMMKAQEVENEFNRDKQRI